MSAQKLLAARDAFIMVVSLVLIYFFEHRMGLDFFAGNGDLFIVASLVLLIPAAGVGLYFRKLLLARSLYFIALTLVLIFAMGPELFDRRGDYWIGAAMVLALTAIPVAVYLARPSVRSELPFVYNLRAGQRAVIKAE